MSEALLTLTLGRAILDATDADTDCLCRRLERGPLLPAEADRLYAQEWWMGQVYAIDTEALARWSLARDAAEALP